jgi:hypothetical protein
MKRKPEIRPRRLRSSSASVRTQGSDAPSRTPFALAFLFAMAAALAFATSPALAKEVHVYHSSFGSAGSGPGQFNKPAGVAVNSTTHDVYVVDQGNNRVEEFNAAGTTLLAEFNGSGAPTGVFSEPTEIAVDNSGSPLDPSAGDVYVVDLGHGVIDKFDSSGTYVGQITGAGTPGGPFEPGGGATRSIEGVAVDPSGTVWITVRSGPIYSFSDALENGYVSQRETAYGGAYEGLGVDGEDNLYLYTGGGTFAKLNSAGETLSYPFGGDKEAYRIAVDPVGQEVYLDNEGVSEATVEAFSLSGVPIETFGAGHIAGPFPPYSKGVAVDASNGNVYVSGTSQDNVSIFEGFVQPTVAIGPVSGQATRGLTLNGSVNPEGKPVASCVFEYGATSAYGQSVPCSPASLGTGSAPVPVSAQLTGLAPESVYHYRLVASNDAGTSATEDQELHTGPVLGGESVSDVAASSATLRDPIDPNGADTHYYVRYGPTPAYGSYAPVEAPGVDLGSAVGVQSVSVHLQGLQAGMVYHYAFVAVQDGEAFEEADRSFMTQSAGAGGALADGRAWELVSPADKHGALIEMTAKGSGAIQAASDGSGISYLTRGPNVTEGAAGNTEESTVLSRRGPAGWESVDLTLPGRLPENKEPAFNLFTVGGFSEYQLFSPGLSLAVVEPLDAGTPLLSPEATERTLYLRNTVDGTFTPLVTPANVPEGTKIEEESFIGASSDQWEMHFLAATPDLSHVVFKTPKALTPEAIDEETVEGRIKEGPGAGSNPVQWNLYEWSGGTLQLVNILPAPGDEVAHGRYTKNVPGVRLAGTIDEQGFGLGSVQRNVSSDGRRIAWTWGEPYGKPGPPYRGLYVRDMVEERTERVGGASAVYQTMNSDGSKIFFLENGELYEWDFDTGTQTDLTSSHGAGESSAGVQEAVSDVSEDGSYVYFVAKGVLAARGVAGENNLYVSHDTGNGWTTAFVAALSQEDLPSWYSRGLHGAPSLSHVASRVSPDGRYLAFMSSRSLTGYDNRDAVSGQPDEEVFLYDAREGRLVCASCNPTGARPSGVFDHFHTVPGPEVLVDRPETWTSTGGTDEGAALTNHWLAGSIPGWDDVGHAEASVYQPRYLSDSGRLFFDSPDALVAQDTNGLEDVYEYEPVGVGTCTTGTFSASSVYSEAAGGCIGLMSSGKSSSESVFYDASETGNDVFFTTTSRLLRGDYDNSYDVYDAHVCSSGVPCRSEPVSPPPCSSGDSCKAAPSPQPEIYGAAPSATFNGAGNVVPETKIAVKPKVKPVKCRRGFAKKHGRCVKRPKSKKVKAKKAGNHRGAKR